MTYYVGCDIRVRPLRDAAPEHCKKDPYDGLFSAHQKRRDIPLTKSSQSKVSGRQVYLPRFELFQISDHDD